MSLDVYLYEIIIATPPELCLECVSSGDEHPHENCVFTANVTHNLIPMAREAGIYEACWRPGELMDPFVAAEMRVQEAKNNYHGPGGAYELEGTLPKARARHIVPLLFDALHVLRGAPERFRPLQPDNGWGSYHGFVTWIDAYAKACLENPDALIRVSR